MWQDHNALHTAPSRTLASEFCSITVELSGRASLVKFTDTQTAVLTFGIWQYSSETAVWESSNSIKCLKYGQDITKVRSGAASIPMPCQKLSVRRILKSYFGNGIHSETFFCVPLLPACFLSTKRGWRGRFYSKRMAYCLPLNFSYGFSPLGREVLAQGHFRLPTSEDKPSLYLTRM